MCSNTGKFIFITTGGSIKLKNIQFYLSLAHKKKTRAMSSKQYPHPIFFFLLTTILTRTHPIFYCCTVPTFSEQQLLRCIITIIFSLSYTGKQVFNSQPHSICQSLSSYFGCLKLSFYWIPQKVFTGKIFTKFLHVYNSLWPLQVKAVQQDIKSLALIFFPITLHCLWYKALMLKSRMTI